MLKRLPIDGGPVVAFEARDKLTHEDYQDVLVPRIQSALSEKEGLKFLGVLGNAFQGMTLGAMWDDLKFDVRHRRDFERIAIVTDHKGLRAACRLSAPLFSGEMRLYHMDQQNKAEAWVTEGVEAHTK